MSTVKDMFEYVSGSVRVHDKIRVNKQFNIN